MKSRSRSFSGIALMLVLIPMFAGILACMPVPIGDPERSRVDPDLTGVWAVLSPEENADEASFYVIERYDKRTWLITGIHLEAGRDSILSDHDLSTYDGYASLAAAAQIGDDLVHVDSMVIYKAWLKKLGGEHFMTWEPKVLLENGIPDPEVWFVYRIMDKDPNRLQLRWLNGESQLFKDVDETRRAYEKVIRKNVNDPHLYHDPIDVGDMKLVRVQEGEMEFFEELLGTIVDWN